MDASSTAQLITAVTGLLIAVGGGVVWLTKHWEARKTKRTEKAALKTVTSWERTVQRKDEEIETWRTRFAMLTEDYQRARELLQQQDDRIARKDARIAHLEKLCDRRGIQS